MNAIMTVGKPLGAAAALIAATDVYLAFAELARLVDELSGATRMLTAAREAAMDVFIRDYVGRSTT
jgi:hypothetical protein